jgi:sugar phosphate isomerase/epimerase
MHRRHFLKTSALATAGLLTRSPVLAADQKPKHPDLVGQMGITTGSFNRNIKAGKFALIDLPKIMRDELDLKVIDLMTATFPYQDPKYCERFRKTAEDAGRIVTNLKMNLEVDLANPDEAGRKAAIAAFKEAVDSAALLGCRWVRPAPSGKAPDMKRLADGYRELIEYAAPKGISLLVENNAWLSNDPTAIPRVIETVGPGVAAQPDTGNWTAEARYEGLEKAYPLAVTCDFKAFELGPNGEHEKYDLRRCFDIGWKAGYRGPWCFEHFHEELQQLLKEFALLRDLLRKWSKESAA